MVNFLVNIEYSLNWGEIYYAIKKGYIDIKDLLILKSQIKKFDENRYFDIILSIDESYFDVLKLIKSYMCTDSNCIIEHNELDITEKDLDYIPDKFKIYLDKVFECSLLLEVISFNGKDTYEKFYRLYLLHDKVDYKEEWKQFIPFHSNPNISNKDLELLFFDFCKEKFAEVNLKLNDFIKDK